MTEAPASAPRTDRVRVAVVDRHRLVVDGLAARLSAPQACIDVVAALTDWAELLESPAFPVDVVVLELDAEDVAVTDEHIAQLTEHNVPTIVVGRRIEPALVHEVDRAGAASFVATSEGADVLVQAIHAAASGEDHQAPVAAAALAEWASRTEPTLGRQELAALRLYAAGRSVHEVAMSMSTTDETVKSYIKRGRRKYRAAGVDLGTKVLLRRHAIQEGWIPQD